MLLSEQEVNLDDPEIKLLKEWLPKISDEGRAYIKGASKALLYAQETSGTVVKQTMNLEPHHDK
ncbi:MAG: hypothetical protein LBI14_04790 [Treponema sp.]|jgi:hypothetical protein|nr:hypothetical protein [Treponema sp.]